MTMVKNPRTGSTADRLPAIARRWWRAKVIKSVDHQQILTKLREEAGWDARYAFMVFMSAGIAVLGLLLSSPAVVIGAMLISPLMGPIIGLGFALATFDSQEIRRTLIALAGGTIVAILFCALIVMVSPLQNVTSEIAARTRPNLFDLMVALFSALAGAYAMIRGRAGTVVGVAIATALMPPLAVVGFGLATLNFTVFSGALLLFITNFVTIAIAAAMMARLYGFGPLLSPKQTLVQSLVILGIMLVLAVPLGLTLRQLAWEASASRQARDVIASYFPSNARIGQIDLDYTASPLRITSTMLTPEYRTNAERDAAANLRELFDRPVELSVQQVRVGRGAGVAEAAQLAAAQESERQRAVQQEVDGIAKKLSLVAGVAPDAVLVDREKRVAFVHASPLPGATLSTYRALEQRVAAADKGWNIILVPPATSLPRITVTDGTADSQMVALITWAAQRVKLPVGVNGASKERQVIAEALRAAGVETEELNESKPGLRWLAPAPPVTPVNAP